MVKRDLEKERQVELAAIWGSETDGEHRFPRRRRGVGRQNLVAAAAASTGDEDVISNTGGDVISKDGGLDSYAPKKKKEVKKKVTSTYRLHCFVAPGTERNAVRTVFEGYEPKVELRVSQKGNLLNKTHYAVLTFRNKAMAMHAVKMLDGTNQNDLIGMKEMKLRLMLSRREQGKARKKMRRQLLEERGKQKLEEEENDANFMRQFLNKFMSNV